MNEVLLLVMTDGRDAVLRQTIEAAMPNLGAHVGRLVVHDDTGDRSHRELLELILKVAAPWVPVEVIGGCTRLGFGGAIRNAWRHLCATAEQDQCGFVFHLEDDFVLDRPVELDRMETVLNRRPELVQLALRRQPWNDAERAAGGVVELQPDAYADVSQQDAHGVSEWLEHRLFFTTNPSLYRRSLCWTGWPDTAHSEGHFTAQLLEDPVVRFGYWGARASGEWVTHIGTERVGTGY